jgi:hypothetical protein
MLATEEAAMVGTKVLLFWTTTMIVHNKPLGVVSEGPREDTGDPLTRVNSTHVLNEGLRIREIGRRMNSKVKSVEIGVCQK